MKRDKEYIPLEALGVYQMARSLSRIAWLIYEKLDWQTKKIMGDQFIESTDSIGANLAEGYSRFHYLEKIKFYYTSRGSLTESWKHWLSLLEERNKVSVDAADEFRDIAEPLHKKLNRFIATTYHAKQRNG